MTGANYSKGPDCPTVLADVDGTRYRAHHRVSREILAPGTIHGGGNLEPGDPQRPSGTIRIEDHATLPPLPAVPWVTFTFDGADISGRRGEPVAAALLAAGVRVFRTMPRFGDARGGYCMVGRCSDCLVEIDGVPGMRSCVTPVSAGMAVRTQFGLGEVADPAGPEFPG